MPDDMNLQRPQDASLIVLDDERQVRYWIDKWNVTEDELAAAVAKVGKESAAVARHLGRSEYD